MITPRRTRLVRVPDLHAFRHLIVALACEGSPDQLASRLVLVPTADAGRQLGRAMGTREAPLLVTRDELYDRLHKRLPGAPPRLDSFERIVMMQSAAREAVNASPGESGTGWRLRPGLVAEALRFYDQLRRQSRNVARFEELLVEALSSDIEHDRGAERMLAQGRWLAATFRGYEARVVQSGACDEHSLRERLIASPTSDPVRHVIVTLGDWIADPDGLFLADFDMLTRMPGVETIDVVSTTTLLASGFHQRVHEWLPGIEEVEAADLDLQCENRQPVLAVPGDDPQRPYFVYRDREEELIAIARRLTADTGSAETLHEVAVVFRRPLPYLYLARDVFGSARIPYEAFDALPLAAEPFSAAVDLVFDFVESAFTRSSTVALLKAPHFAFLHEGERVDAHSIDALDRALSSRRFLGSYDALMAIDSPDTLGDADGWPALRAAQAAAAALAPLQSATAASSQFRTIIEFLAAHEPSIDDDDALAPRLRRQRAAVLEVLQALAAAHARHDDGPIGITEVASAARLWIEAQTFVADPGGGGIQLVDDQAARYGEFADMTLVGLIEGEWPERPTRNIFFPPSLLVSLGWPTEKDRRGAATARFLELIRSAGRRVAVSTVSLDEEALVEPSFLVEEIAHAGLTPAPVISPAGIAGWEDSATTESAREWLALRSRRSSPDSELFHGQTASIPQQAWGISSLETYLDCPFKFFAKHVLRLDDEPDDEEVLDPRSRGQLVHDVFEAFFTRWQREGNQAITPETIDAARAMFLEVVEDLLVRWRLSETEAALERTRLIGSPAAAGLGEAVLRMEAERPVAVRERLLEHRFTGEFTFHGADGPRRLAIRGKADRIDLLEDGSFRLIDYKLGWPPNKARALQLPIYSICAEQSLSAQRGRSWALGEAAYLAFKGPRRVVGLFNSNEERTRVLADAQQRLLDTVDAIQAGRFPPAPDDIYRCEMCSYSAVCRKDYVGDV